MALIGSIIGDIIGSQYEFPNMRPDDLDWRNCELFTNKCEFTDDTVMSIATKVGLEKYKCDFARAYREFGRKYPDVGYGDSFEKWLYSENPKPYESWGNGAAMRVSYIGDKVQDTNSVFILAKHSASCTHNSVSGIRGAIITTSVIAMAKSGLKKTEIYDFVNEQYKGCFYDCSEPLSYLREHYHWSDTCDKTVPIAIRCFLDSTDYESCMRNCLSLPCDMDTVCCIAGGMAEAFYGTTELNNKEILQRYLDDYLYEQIADLLEGE